jgi:hypothetical protein
LTGRKHRREGYLLIWPRILGEKIGVNAGIKFVVLESQFSSAYLISSFFFSQPISLSAIRRGSST